MYKEMFNTEDLENAAEELVFEELHRILSEEAVTFCRCDICLLDIAALTLNSIPSKYANSYIAKHYPNEDMRQSLESLRKMVKHAMAEAIKLVGDNPHH